MQQLSGLNKQSMAAMSGFTSDFFLTLETSFSDNTLNDSRMNGSQLNPNRSGLLRELKQESLEKIVEKMQRLVLGVVFEQLYRRGIKVKRIEDKTPINIYKNFYKINLMLNVKLSTKVGWAFHRINKFTSQFHLEPIPIQQQFKNNKEATPIKEQPVPSKADLQMVKINSQDGESSKSKVNMQRQQKNLNKFCERLIQIISQKQIKTGFKNIQKEEYEIEKKLYFFQLTAHTFYTQMRHHFLQIYNSNQNTFAPIRAEKVIPSFNTEPLIKLSKMPKQNGSKIVFRSDKNINQQKRTNPPLGLKFNRCLKKTNQRNQLNFPNTKTPIINTNTIKFKSFLRKSCKVQTALSEIPMFRQFVWEDFTYSQRTYHLAPQEVKVELPDIQDKLTLFENDQMLDSKKSTSLNSKLTFSKRLHKLQSKSPLEFSNKRAKSRNSSIRSKKSVGKVSETENEANQQSLKSYYYFPEKQNYGKAEVSIAEKPQSPTKYIGSTVHTKKRTTTETSGRSTDKINPYFQQLKERTSRKPIQSISLHKMIERSLSGRSTSRKVSRQKDRQREIPRRILIQQPQISPSHREKTQKQQKTSRNISPQPQKTLHQQRSVEQLNFVGVPKEWYVYRNSPKNQIHTRVRESKPMMQFQKIESNVFRL